MHDSKMLFLGAGASKAFGVGDLKDVTSIAKDKLRKEGYTDLLNHIHKTLSDVNQTEQYFANEDEIDIEVILSLMDLLVHRETIANKLGPSGIYLNQLANTVNSTYKERIPDEREFYNITKIVEDIIVESCNSCDFQSANEYYGRLFSFETSATSSYVNARNEHPRLQLFKHVVTTNYDLVLERYDKDGIDPSKHLLCRGFTRGGYDWNEPYLDIEKMSIAETHFSPMIQYLKLHGSIDWWIRSRDNKIVMREYPTSLMGETYDRRQMIYPVYDKHVSEDPYGALYNYFRGILRHHDMYIVIGYSFRDPSINNAFRDLLNSRPESRMIIINNDPATITTRIQNFPNGKLDMITTSFGDQNLINDLHQVVNSLPQGYNI